MPRITAPMTPGLLLQRRAERLGREMVKAFRPVMELEHRYVQAIVKAAKEFRRD